MAGRERDDHKKRLENSQAFLSLAFKTVCTVWQGLDQQGNNPEEKEKILNKRMDAKPFKEVAGSWISLYKTKIGWPPKWSTVDIKQYYHEYSLDESILPELKRPCRDSRYKFDSNSDKVWDEVAKDSASLGFKLIEFLKKCHVDDPKLLSKSEFKQLVELYKDKETRGRCDVLAAKAAAKQSLVPEVLKSLLLSGFPLPEPTESPEREVEAEFQMPVGRAQIHDWVYAESRILQPNVMRQFITEDIEPILDVLEWAAPKHGRAVFDDFRLRVRNESSLIWNDVRQGRTVNTLKRKWNHPDVSALTETDGDEGE